ncbi:MAG: NADH:flavin oxidoreductase [Acidimicrobiales bacterium]|nr:NADH:flavin oxidoreductase [Acidimicrobiales bacterium]
MSGHQLYQPARIGPIEVRNRTVKAATYESLGRDGLVTDELIAWHAEIARGGVGVDTLSYCSVAADGRTFGDQLVMRDAAMPGLTRFCQTIRATGATPAVQLGHAGWFADPHATGERPMGPSAQFSPHGGARSRPMTVADIERVTQDFAAAAAGAAEAGFGGVEIHVGHGYLLSQFLCPWNNRRDDAYGGTIENRARFAREVCRAVRDRVGGEIAIWAKLNMDDGFRGGMTLDDGLAVARLLDADGSLDALQLTGGHTTRSPMYLMRGAAPRKEMFEDDPNAIRRTMMRLGAPLFIREIPFEEAFFRPKAELFRRATDLPVMLLGGLTRRDTMEDAIDGGFGFVTLGRALLREPDLINRYASGAAATSRCVPCNQCMAKVGYQPTQCVRRSEPIGQPTG